MAGNWKLIFFVISAGIRSNLDLFSGTDLKAGQALETDACMRTSEKDIYAAGDNALVEGRFYGLWMPALLQGQVAARNMAGIESRFEPMALSAHLKVLGLPFFSVGDFTADKKESRVFEKNNRWELLFLSLYRQCCSRSDIYGK